MKSIKNHFWSIGVLIMVLVSCNNYRGIKKAPNNTSEVFLCYISSKPKIRSLNNMDTSFISLIDYKIRKNIGVEGYEVIEIEIVPVDYFLSENDYELGKKLTQALNRDMPPKNFFLKRFDLVYILVKKKDNKTKRIINRNYRNGKNIAIEFSEIYNLKDTLEQMVSTKVYNYKKISDFDHMIRYD